MKLRKKVLSVVAIAAMTAVTWFILRAGNELGTLNWPQWGQNPQRHGFVNARGQEIESQRANLV